VADAGKLGSDWHVLPLAEFDNIPAASRAATRALISNVFIDRSF
jgi:hypothetical protein